MADTDDDLLQSLELFNTRLEASAEQERAERIVAKAERRKKEAANRVKDLGRDDRATAEDKAEAEAAYRAAVDEVAARTADPFGRKDEPTEPAEGDGAASPPDDTVTPPDSAAADSDAEAVSDAEADSDASPDGDPTSETEDAADAG